MATYADIARLDAILKDRPVVDAIQEALNKATPLAEKFTQQLTLSGRKGIFPVQFGVNEGVYYRLDRGTFGDAQSDQPSLAEIYAKFMYAIFEISGPVMSATRDSQGAFEDALSLQLENTIDGVKLDAARTILGDGSGKVAVVESRTDADTLVVRHPFNLTYKAGRPVKNILRKGMPFDVIDTDGSTVNVSNGLITALTHGTANSTLDGTYTETATPAVGDFIVRPGNLNKEVQGFFGAVATAGTYLAIARAGQTGWQGVVTDAAAGGAAAVALDPDMLRDQMDLIMENSGKTPDLIVGNYKQRRAIYNLYAPQIRYAPMVLPAGLRESTLAFDDVPVLAERFFPPEHIGFVNTSTWYHCIDKDVEWIQGQGGTVLNFLLSSDLFRAVLRTYRNLACLFPAANGYIFGLEE